MKPNDYLEKHWENMKCLVVLEAKQGEIAWNHAVRTLVNTPRHFGHGGEVGATQLLLLLPFFFPHLK